MHYPGAVPDPDTGAWISDAEVAEISFTAFASTTDAGHRPADRAPGQRRPPPRRAVPGVAISPVLHQHRRAAADADITHRRHAIIETTFADLIDGPLAHMPSGRFGANSAWVLCAAITHNLLRAAGTLAGAATPWPAARPCAASIVTIPARLARPQRRPVLHLPSHWPWAHAWLALWRNTIGDHRHCPPQSDHPPKGPTGDPQESWANQQIAPAQNPKSRSTARQPRQLQLISGSRLKDDAASRRGREPADGLDEQILLFDTQRRYRVHGSTGTHPARDHT